MKYKKYYRKTSLKQKGVGEFFLDEVRLESPKVFLEIGVFHGVTARNVCELLHKIHQDNFKYIGIDLFEESTKNENEVIPKTKFNNLVKNFYYNYIIRQNPYSKIAVENLLKKFEKNTSIIKGDSNEVLKKIDTSKIDYVFLDGGHNYQTVINDLNFCIEVIKNDGVILCDDYDLTYAPGVKKAIDEFVQKNNFRCEFLWNTRFAKLTKKN